MAITRGFGAYLVLGIVFVEEIPVEDELLIMRRVRFSRTNSTLTSNLKASSMRKSY